MPGPVGLTGSTGAQGIQGVSGYTIVGQDGDDGQDGLFNPAPYTAPLLPSSVLTPLNSQQLLPNYSAVVVRSYKIASGMKLELGLGSRMRIL